MFQEIIQQLLNAHRVLFITGAGISADSGLPTYRGIGGLYNDKKTEEGVPIEEVLSAQVFNSTPQITWKYLYQIEKACRYASFNEAHEVIAKLERELTHTCVLTQNIDALHTKAGSQNIIEIHGNLYELICIRCAQKEIISDYSTLEEIPPLCKRCDAIVRPDVVLFDEMLPTEKLRLLEKEIQLGFDVVCSIGTTSTFPYIAGPVYDAVSRQACTIEINPSETEISHIVTYKLTTTAKEAMLKINQLWEQSKMN